MTVPDLPPDVRDGAARAANGVWIDRPNAEMLFEDWREVVDAVVAVVAPEIARPLQARVEELSGELSMALEVATRRGAENKMLEGHLSDNRKMWDVSIAQTGAALELHDTAKARVEELEGENERLRRTSIVDNAYVGREIKVEFDDE